MWDWLTELLGGFGGMAGDAGQVATDVASTIAPELDLWNEFAKTGLSSPGMDLYGDIGSTLAPTASSSLGSTGAAAPSIAGGFGGGQGDETLNFLKSAGKGALKGLMPAAGALAVGAMSPRPKMPPMPAFPGSVAGQAPTIPPYTQPPGAKWSPLLRQVPRVNESQGLRIGL